MKQSVIRYTTKGRVSTGLLSFIPREKTQNVRARLVIKG